MSKKVTEEGAIITVSNTVVPSKKMEVFYNPIMKHQRDIAIEIIKHFELKKIGLPLAGTGIRGIRILQAIPDTEIYFNDISSTATKLIENNLKENNIFSRYSISNKDANIFLREGRGFDYIDIDPYGSSVYFIESALHSLRNKGILAVTNTDTAALCGSYPTVCKRRYGSKPIQTEMMHEFGTRILIKKIQEIGAMHDKAIIPILAYAKDHYIRAYFKVSREKKLCNELLKKHVFYSQEDTLLLEESTEGYGPVWKGQLVDKEIAQILPKNTFNDILKEESQENITFGYDLHEICPKMQIAIPRSKKVIEKVKEKGYFCSKTIFSETAVKTNMPKKEFLELLTHC